MSTRGLFLAATPAVIAGFLAACANAEGAGSEDGSRGGDEEVPSSGDGASGTSGGPGPAPQSQSSKSGGKERDGRLGTNPDALGCPTDLPTTQYYLSADDSNSMASPARARELLEMGKAPPPSEIRTYEFLNYYNVFTGSNAGGISVSVHMAPGASPTLHQLLIAIESAPLEAPPPKALTFVVDTSGSMSGDSIARARVALQAVAGNLHAGDVVNLVTWSEDEPLLDGLQVGGPDDPTLLEAINSLEAGGGSDVVAGLASAYDLAASHKRDDGLNRVVLISDGGASTAEIDEEVIASFASAGDLHGIYIVGVGTGPAQGYDDGLMDFVTEAGRGAYVYLDDQAEAARMFGERFEEVMDVAARDVQVQLTLPGFFDIAEFYGEGYSAEGAAIEPQHLAPNDSMAFYQTVSATCSKNELPLDSLIEVKVTWVDPSSGQPREQILSKKIFEVLGGHPALDKAAAIAAYGKALATADGKRLTAAHDAAKAALATNPNDADLEEIEALVQKHPAFSP